MMMMMIIRSLTSPSLIDSNTFLKSSDKLSWLLMPNITIGKLFIICLDASMCSLHTFLCLKK